MRAPNPDLCRSLVTTLLILRGSLTTLMSVGSSMACKSHLHVVPSLNISSNPKARKTHTEEHIPALRSLTSNYARSLEPSKIHNCDQEPRAGCIYDIKITPIFRLLHLLAFRIGALKRWNGYHELADDCPPLLYGRLWLQNVPMHDLELASPPFRVIDVLPFR